MSELYKPNEAATQLHISTAYLAELARAGKIASEKTSGGHRRYTPVQLARAREWLDGNSKTEVIPSKPQTDVDVDMLTFLAERGDARGLRAYISKMDDERKQVAGIEWGQRTALSRQEIRSLVEQLPPLPTRLRLHGFGVNPGIGVISLPIFAAGLIGIAMSEWMILLLAIPAIIGVFALMGGVALMTVCVERLRWSDHESSELLSFEEYCLVRDWYVLGEAKYPLGLGPTIPNEVRSRSRRCLVLIQKLKAQKSITVMLGQSQ